MTITGKDQSILFQVAYKGAIALAAAGKIPADDASIFAKTYEHYDFHAAEHGFNETPLAKASRELSELQEARAIEAESLQRVQDAFPGTTDETPRDTKGYEFTGDCKLPVPDYFYTQVEAKGASNLKYWWDNRLADGSAPVGETGKKRPSFTSKVPKGGDKSKQVAIFEPDKPRAR